MGLGLLRMLSALAPIEILRASSLYEGVLTGWDGLWRSPTSASQAL